MRVYDLIAKKRDGGMDDGGLPVRSPPKSTAAALPMAQRGPRKTPSFTPLLPRTVWSGTEDGCACVKT